MAMEGRRYLAEAPISLQNSLIQLHPSFLAENRLEGGKNEASFSLCSLIGHFLKEEAGNAMHGGWKKPQVRDHSPGCPASSWGTRTRLRPLSTWARCWGEVQLRGSLRPGTSCCPGAWRCPRRLNTSEHWPKFKKIHIIRGKHRNKVLLYCAHWKLYYARGNRIPMWA